jgi:hypothetical protein
MISTHLVQCCHEVTNDTAVAIDGNRDSDRHCAGSHLHRVVDFLCSCGTFLCGTNDEERHFRVLPHRRKPRDTRHCCSRKTVSYHDQVEIREYASTTMSDTLLCRKYNSYHIQMDWYYAPSFYRHINDSKQRTARYRLPPILTVTQRRRRLLTTAITC